MVQCFALVSFLPPLESFGLATLIPIGTSFLRLAMEEAIEGLGWHMEGTTEGLTW